MSRYVEVEIPESYRFFDMMLLCWQMMHILLVAMEFGSCFVINDSFRLVQYLKWLRFIAQNNVDLIFMKAAQCRKYSGSALVF